MKIQTLKQICEEMRWQALWSAPLDKQILVRCVHDDEVYYAVMRREENDAWATCSGYFYSYIDPADIGAMGWLPLPPPNNESGGG